MELVPRLRKNLNCVYAYSDLTLPHKSYCFPKMVNAPLVYVCWGSDAEDVTISAGENSGLSAV